MHRFYLPPDQTRGPNLVLADSEAHHALHVLRLRAGERVVVLNGVGEEFLCEIEGTERRTVRLRMLQKQFIPPLPYRVTLIQAAPKGKTMEVIVQKATELGAHRIVPILSERTVAQVDPQNAAGKMDKWHATAIESIKQCGSAWLPKIDVPSAPHAFLAQHETFELSLVATLQPGACHPRKYFQSFQEDYGRMPSTIGIWVGPEGDYTPAEIHAMISSGALPITLGPLILRSETAAIYCLAVLNYELQSAKA